MKCFKIACSVALTLAASVAISNGTSANPIHHRGPPPKPIACADVAGKVTGQPGVESATSAIVPASAPNLAYCRVDILYGNSAAENINIAVSLPLNSVDGGTGGVEGAWNGRTQGIGGGGCSGGLNPVGPVNAGYVGSQTDLGHTGGDCERGVKLDGTYNVTFIDDFIRVAIKQQILFSKVAAKSYYGQKAAYNYWNGCSTGGRQGYLLAQELPNELDGIMANAPAMYSTRFQTAQMWGQIVMKDLTGGVIPAGKLNYASDKATAACDGDDGVLDGIIDDPRTCTYSAAKDPSAICAADGGTSADPHCLTLTEAQAVDKIWDGPRNAHGKKIWYHSEPGSGLTIWNGPAPFALSNVQFHWNERDRNFDWHTVTQFGAGGTKSYADVAQDGSTNQFLPGTSLADETDTFGNLDKFRRSGGKLLTWVGGYDNFIMPRGVIKYYREMASRYDPGFLDNIGSQKIDFRHVQKFYRLFLAPGVGHCGFGGGPNLAAVGPVPVDAFGALVDWVEHGNAPATLLAQGGAVPSRTRPLCPYPQRAIYSGSGSIDDAANFHCGGNLETKETVCKDVLVKYKHEVNGPLDYLGTGVNSNICNGKIRSHFPSLH
jgi:hypothetical protein